MPTKNEGCDATARAPSSRFLATAGAGALALLLAAGGCAVGSAGNPGPFERAEAGDQRVSVHVRNLNFSEATLWAVSRGGRQRLGVVGGKGDAVYTIPWRSSQPMQIEIDLLAGPRCTTEPLEVDPGDSLDVQIEVSLDSQPNCR